MMTSTRTSQLTEETARLLHVIAPSGSNARAGEIARAVALLLGVAAPSGARLSAFARQRSATSAADPPGILARLRKLFDKP